MPLAACAVTLALAGCDRRRSEPAVHVAGGDAARGRSYVAQYGCGTCHVIPGVAGADGLVGAPLTRFATRRYVAGALLNTPDNLVLWLVDPQAVEPGTTMPALGVPEAHARDMAAYLYTLGEESPVGPKALLPVEWLHP